QLEPVCDIPAGRADGRSSRVRAQRLRPGHVVSRPRLVRQERQVGLVVADVVAVVEEPAVVGVCVLDAREAPDVRTYPCRLDRLLDRAEPIAVQRSLGARPRPGCRGSAEHERSYNAERKAKGQGYTAAAKISPHVVLQPVFLLVSVPG